MADLKEIQIGSNVYTIKDAIARNAIGSPLVANTVASMTNASKIYVYTGSETGYSTGHWYYHNGSAWTDGGVYNSQGIGSGAVNGQKLSDDLKEALLTIFEHVAFTDANGQTYYNNLLSAFNSGAVIQSISAVFNQVNNIIFADDSLDELKKYLTVTAHYDDDSSRAVTNYALSGILTEGTSTITVTYGGKTSTFNVTVTKSLLYPLAVGTHPITVDSNTVGTMTISNGAYTHVKLEFTSNAVIPNGGTNPYYFIRLNVGDCGRVSITRNQPQWFNIPANVECSLELANVVNAPSVDTTLNFRKANDTTSASFPINISNNPDGLVKTVTLETAESVSCLFFYTAENRTIPAGTVWEFDVRFTVDGERYF